MNDDDVSLRDDEVLVKGKEVPKENIAGTNTNSSLAQGLAYIGVALLLSGPMRILLRLPNDLTTVETVSAGPAIEGVLLGLIFIFAGGLYAVITSPPIARVAIAARRRFADGVNELADPTLEED